MNKIELFRKLSQRSEMKEALNTHNSTFDAIVFLDDNDKLRAAHAAISQDLLNRMHDIDAVSKAWLDAGGYQPEQRQALRKEYKEWLGKQ